MDVLNYFSTFLLNTIHP